MSDRPPRQVFEFSPDESDFWPSADFKSDLEASHNPFVIMLIGSGRTGKSTRANQLLCHTLRATHPFEAQTGSEPVTMKFQYVGPLSFAAMAQLHGIQLQVHGNPEIFLIDCEGLHSLGETTATLKQATFALSQLVSMTVLVMKEHINHENIRHIRSLFELSHAFIRGLPGFAIGTTIMMREVGVRCPRGRVLSLDEKNALRQTADIKQRTTVLEVLNEAKVRFSEHDLLVLAQPGIDEPALYWTSINDFLTFCAAIASERRSIPGETLLQVLHDAKPSIMQITDFANPAIPFETIMRNITCRYLAAGRAAALADVETEIGGYLRALSAADLRGGLDVNFVAGTINKCVVEFERHAERLFPHVLENSPEDTARCRTEVRDSVQQSCDRLFVSRCLAALVPDVEAEVVEQTKGEIAVQMRGIAITDIGVFSFTDLSARHEGSAEAQFGAVVTKVHRGIASSAGFAQFVGSLRAKVADHVKAIESAKRQEYSQHVDAENELQRQKLEEQFQENLKKMSEEEAKKQRELEEEKAEIIRQRQEGQSRHRVAMEQAKAAMELQQRNHEERIAAMKAAEEKAEADNRALLAKMEADRKASEAAWERRNDEERRARNQQVKDLENQIQQLRNRPPQVIHVYHKRHRFLGIF